MNNLSGRVVLGTCVLALTAISVAPVIAQSDSKEKDPMYSYIGNWSIPRAQWAEMDKNIAADDRILQKALASGAIVGYGF